jgi:glycosyltransferase involved in cell wall biosynthesis
MGPLKKYLYAIIDSSEPVGCITGIDGSALYNVSYRDIGAVAGDINIPPGEMTRGYVMAHEDAVEKLMERYTVLPARFLSVFDKDNGILSVLSEHYGVLAENLDRVRGKVEFGIKALGVAGNTGANFSGASDISDSEGASPGKSYMSMRMREHMFDEAARQKAEWYMNAVNSSFFQGIVTEYNVERPKGERRLLSAAYLVERDKVQSFREAFEGVRASFPELKFLLSGPWPPYNFIKTVRL